MRHKTIPVGQLLLDTENPRYDAVHSQRDAIRAIIAGQGQKLLTLALDMSEYGPSPIDQMLVIERGKNYTVVEGNRRLAAIRLLGNPGLAEGTDLAAALKRIAVEADPPQDVECAVADSREEAEHWMTLRHTGEANGAGVVRWNAVQNARFHRRPGSQADKALMFLSAVEVAFPYDEVMLGLVARVATQRITTLGRLVADPNFKERVGLVDNGDTLTFHYPAAALQKVLGRVLGDLATDLSVTQVKTKADREAYLKEVPKPPKKEYQKVAQPLSPAPEPKPTTAPKAPRRKPKKETKPFGDLQLDDLGPRIVALVKEFRSLDIDKVPNTAGILMRVILDLTVDEFIARKNIKRSRELKDRVRRCLKELDPSEKDKKYQWIRAGLNDATSWYAVSTLHAFVHNTRFHADGGSIRGIAPNLEPFIQDLNDAL